MNIIILDNDVNFRKSISDILRTHDFNVTEVSNTQETLLKIKSSQYDVLISDIQPSYLETNFFKTVKNEFAVPIIMVSHINDRLRKVASVLPIDEHLTKPVDEVEILEAIESVRSGLYPIDTVAGTIYSRIPIENFIISEKLDFDVFIKLNDNKMIKIGKKGGPTPFDRIELYKNKGIKYFFARSEDSLKLLANSNQILKAAAKSPLISVQKKIQLINFASEVIFERLKVVKCFSLEDINEAKNTMQSVVQVFDESYSALNLVETLNKNSNWLLAHSLGVSMFMVLLAKQYKYFSPNEIRNFALAGLLHDLGLSEIEDSILNKPIDQMDKIELSIYDRHPIITRDILLSSVSIPSDIVEIITHHEELDFSNHISPDKRILKKGIEILNAADYLMARTVSNPLYEQSSADDVIKEMIGPLKSKFSTEVVSVLSRQFA